MRNTLCISAVLLALPACGTEEIPTPITTIGREPGPNRGELLIAIAPTAETYQEDQAQALVRTTFQVYGVFVDGSQLVREGLYGYAPEPVTIGEGGTFG